MAKCPTCGGEYKNEKGVKIHHKQAHGESIRGTEHTCEVCDETFTHRSRTRKYCSQECFGKAHSEKMKRENHPMWKGGMVECECEYCGESYHRHPSKANRPYCSQRCSGKAQMEDRDKEDNPFYEGGKKETVECKQCGVDFEAFEGLERKFCSIPCYDKYQVGLRTGPDNPNWGGGVAPYGAGWNKNKKEQVRERDNRECQQCGRSQEEHIELYGERHTVHHIQKARDFDDPEKRNDPDNLITLCKGECHWLWEEMSPLRPIE